MNKDFHFYGTYIAAIIAGYNTFDAQTIARSAQYVDDSSQDKVIGAYLPDLMPVPTVEEFTDIGKNDTINWTESSLIKSARIWVPFHFLPGNFGSYQLTLPDNCEKPQTTYPANFEINPVNLKVYRGNDKVIGSNAWYYDNESKEQFKLLCLPNSMLVDSMINDLRINHRGTAYELYLTGVRMHVLADTWAHCYYAGIPAWFINDIAKEVYDYGKNANVNWLMETATPPSNYFNSFSYLGHGRMGHLPDYPYLRYRYTPQWNGNNGIVKNNPEYFMNAFRQMVAAMRCIRNNNVFRPANQFFPMDEEQTPFNTPIHNIYEYIYTAILMKNQNDQCTLWQGLIERLEIPMPTYPDITDPNHWINIAKDEPEKRNTEYYKFNQSAILHLSFVEGILKSNNVYIGETPASNSLKVTLRTPDGYIGKSYCLSTGVSNYYPTIGSTPVELSLIKPTCKRLESGDVIKIKTSEDLKGYDYLGAWPTPALYYYLKDYNISGQKWRVIKRQGSPGHEIRHNDAVSLENICYDSKPIMNPYSPLAGGKYLTTSNSLYTFNMQFSGENRQIAVGEKYIAVLKSDGTIVIWYSDASFQAFQGINNVKSISGATYHIVALKNDGSVVACGNTFGIYDYGDFGQFNVPANLNNVISISAGDSHTVALKNDGTVVAWGAYAVCRWIPEGVNDIVSIAAGSFHTAALKRDGTVVLWGNNEFGDIDVSQEVKTEVKAKVKGIISIAAGFQLTTAQKADGTLFVWGQYFGFNEVTNYKDAVFTSVFWGIKRDGTLVYRLHDDPSNPRIPEGLTDVISIDVGCANTTAVLKRDGTVITWGNNLYGQYVATAAQTSSKDKIAIGLGYIATLRNDGTVFAWGKNTEGQCNVPANLNCVIAIAAGYYHIAALRSDSTVVAWGYNTEGQCNVPADLSNVIAVAAGEYHTVALKSDGKVIVWGKNTKGQCNVPGDLNNIISIAAGVSHTVALKSDGTVVAWGDNTYCQCNVPINLDNVIAIVAELEYTMVLKSDGTVVAWGDNSEGQCSVPLNANSVISIAASVSCSIALKRDGTIVGWGKMEVPLPDIANVISVTAKANNVAAVRSDGTIVVWGDNTDGQCNVPAGTNLFLGPLFSYYVRR